MGIKDNLEITSEIEDSIEEFQTDLQALDKTPLELASQMRGWGDHRTLQTIMRSIQRMASGATAISGEMRVIIRMMLYQQYLDEIEYANLKWQKYSNGSVSTIVDDFTLSLYPQTKNRWAITIVHKNGYSHPWPTWQNDIEAAKRKALISLSDAIRHVIEYERDQQVMVK